MAKAVAEELQPYQDRGDWDGALEVRDTARVTRVALSMKIVVLWLQTSRRLFTAVVSIVPRYCFGRVIIQS